MAKTPQGAPNSNIRKGNTTIPNIGNKANPKPPKVSGSAGVETRAKSGGTLK